jgi:hypothetical protein
LQRRKIAGKNTRIYGSLFAFWVELPCDKNFMNAKCFPSDCYKENVCRQNVNNSERNLSFQRKNFS